MLGMSNEYDDHKSREMIEWRVGVPLAFASLLIGGHIVENLLSKTSWTVDRGFRIAIASAFMVIILGTWRLILQNLKIVKRLCEGHGETAIDARTSKRLVSLVEELVSLYSTVIIILFIAFHFLQKL